MTDQLAILILNSYIKSLSLLPPADTEEDIEAFKYAIEAIRERAKLNEENNKKYADDGWGGYY